MVGDFVNFDLAGFTLHIWARHYCLNEYFTDLRTSGVLWFRRMEAPDLYAQNIQYALASNDDPGWQFSL